MFGYVMAIVARVASVMFLLAGAGLAATARGQESPGHAVTGNAIVAPGAALQPAVADGEVSLSPAVAFTTLAAAVAAQPLPDAANDETACLAGAIYFESHGEPLVGQLAVAKVILNRTRSGRYPTTICGVVTQRSQFSFVRGGVMPTPPEGAAYRTALAIAELAVSDRWADPSEGALAFHARRVSPGWAMRRVAVIGNHVFYR